MLVSVRPGRLFAAMVSLASLACVRQTPATRAPEEVTSAPVNATSPAPVQGPELSIRLAARLDPRPGLIVELRAIGIAAQTWSIAALATARIEALEVRDDAGAIASEVSADGFALRVRLARAPRGALQLRYLVVPAQEIAPPEVPAGLALRVDHGRVLAAAEEVLLLPDAGGPERLALALEWAAPTKQLQQVASSFGAPGWRGEVPLSALRHAAFLAGPLGHAIFRGAAGDDDFAWTGDTHFDLRWSAAETAGARTAVDLYFGAAVGETRRFTTLMAVDVDFAGGDGVLVYPRSEGLYVAVSPGARWDAGARLAIAQGLVHRWIGGRLRLDAGGEAPRERGAWFDVGFARAVAREVLVELGTLSSGDVLDEVHALVGERATSPLRAAAGDEVATRAAAGEADASALLAARGALYATRLDALLRARGGSLRALLRELVAEARRAGLAELPLSALTDRIAATLGAEEVAVFRGAVLGGGPLPLPADALGPCFVAAPRTYTRFDLGFDAARSRAEAPPVIRGLRPGGPAARAGLREGERLHSFVADPDDPKVRAEVVVERGGREVTVAYLPAGATARAEGWRRRPGADELQCPP